MPGSPFDTSVWLAVVFTRILSTKAPGKRCRRRRHPTLPYFVAQLIIPSDLREKPRRTVSSIRWAAQ